MRDLSLASLPMEDGSRLRLFLVAARISNEGKQSPKESGRNEIVLSLIFSTFILEAVSVKRGVEVKL